MDVEKLKQDMADRYVASMVLAGVGDAMGYKNGEWEFCFDGEKIHKELKKLGGISKLSVKKPDFIVSDDTVLLLSTAEALTEKPKFDKLDNLYSSIAFRYRKDCIGDMNGRAAGMTTLNSIHQLHHDKANGWHLPFNPRGGGCGGAMRSMSIGLRYPNVYDADCLENLIAVSVESGRMTHNHPTGFLGSFASALFGAFSICAVPLHKWGYLLLKLLPAVLRYIELQQRDVEEIKKAWGYFDEQWKEYLVKRNILFGETDAVFPEKYDVKVRDAFYKSCSFHGWGGASGHDAPMIAYDALLFAKDDWVTLCHHGMLHSGDNDSTGVIAGFCYGAMYGLLSVPNCNYKNVEYKDRLTKAGSNLHDLAFQDRYLSSVFNQSEAEIPVDKLFVQTN